MELLWRVIDLGQIKICVVQKVPRGQDFITVRNEVAKVMCLQASVCPKGGGGWGCLPQCMLGYHPPASRPPLEQTPPQEQTPPREQTPPPQSRQPPQSRPPEADTPSGSRDTATAADGTHPTGMHSCLILYLAKCRKD